MKQVGSHPEYRKRSIRAPTTSSAASSHSVMERVLSERINDWVGGRYAKDFAQAYNTGVQNLWVNDAGSGSGGHIVLCRSENKLISDRLASELEDCSLNFQTCSLAYEDYKGSLELREAVCEYVKKNIVGGSKSAEDVVASDICISAGCGVVIENLVLALCDFSDVALVPAPYYSSFDRDLGMRAGVSIECVYHSKRAEAAAAGEEEEEQLSLAVEDFEAAYQKVKAEGGVPKVVLLTNPHNPLGIVYSQKDLMDVLVWAEQRKLHVISDEIYANSIYDHSGDEGSAFTSCIELGRRCVSSGSMTESFRRNFLHCVFGFSKDFGASGLRIGCVHTSNPEILTAWNALGYSCAVSTHTQYVLTNLLKREDFVSSFLEENKKTLREAANVLKQALKEAGIPFVVPRAGLFVWIDLRHLLASSTWQAERDLWAKLSIDQRVVLTPGEFCHAQEPGFFRLCFAWMPDIRCLSEAAKRISAVKE